MPSSSNLRTPLKRARGLGSAHSGTHHFWVLRVSALALVPLSVWFMVELLTNLVGAERGMIGQWFQHPVRAVLMALLLVSLFLHSRLGVQEIIEDYVPSKGKKLAGLILNSSFHYGLAAMSLLAVLHLHLFGI